MAKGVSDGSRNGCRDFGFERQSAGILLEEIRS